MNRRRARPSENKLIYQVLEPRKMLATTLYVDFGFGTGDLPINDAQSAALNGPQVFGEEGTWLESFATTATGTTIDFGQPAPLMDFNYDGVADSADITALVDQVITNLGDIFASFDVDIQLVSSATLDEVADRMSETNTSDAYIFVGGDSTLASPTRLGASRFDDANSKDNFGVVFAKKLFKDVITQEVFKGAPRNFAFGKELSVSLSRNIAKFAAHTYGLEFVEALRPPAQYEIMRLVGTDASGQEYMNEPYEGGQYIFGANDTQIGAFSKRDMELIHIDGVSIGQQNSYEALAANIGVNENSPYYVSGIGFFSDIVIMPDGDSIKILVGDEILTPDGSELTNGILIDAMGANVQMGHLKNFQFDIRFTSRFTIDPSLDDPGADPDYFPVSTFRSGVEVNPVEGTVHLGTINENIRYRYANNDSIVLVGASGRDVFITSPAVRTESVTNYETEYETFLYGLDGHDLFDLGRETKLAAGGPGVDTFRGFEPKTADGGAGFDIFEVDSTQLHYWASVQGVNSGGGFNIRRLTASSLDIRQRLGFERFVFTNLSQDAVKNISTFKSASNTFVHDGTKTALIDQSTGARMEFIGANNIYAKASDFVYVRETIEDLTIANAGYIQLSSNFNPKAGNTEGIQHNIHLSGTVDPTLVIGDQTGSGMTALITKNWLSGLTGDNLQITLKDPESGFFENAVKPNLVVHGSDTAPDYITVAHHRKNLTLNGNGGDDFFRFGYLSDEIGPTSVYHLEGRLEIDGGAGFDVVEVNTDYFVFNMFNRNMQYRELNGQPHPGLGYSDFEFFRVLARTNNRFVDNIWASEMTRYEIVFTAFYAQGTEPPTTDSMININGNQNDGRVFIPDSDAAPEDVSDGITGGVWIFPGSSRLPIRLIRSDFTVPDLSGDD